MSRARTVALSSIALAVAGVVAALAARSDGPLRPSLPPQASLLPADATFILGLDVSRFVASPLYKRFAGGPLAGNTAWTAMGQATGIDPERDIRQMIAAGSGSGATATGVALLVGTFDRARMEKALGAGTSGASSRDHRGTKVWTLKRAPEEKPQSLAILDEGTLLLGAPADVDAALDRRASKTRGLAADGPLGLLVQRVDPGAAFWMVGDQSAMSAVSGAAVGNMTVPGLRRLILSGELEPDLKVTMFADTTDAAEAKKTTDMLRGLSGLLAMQAASRPEMQDLMSGLEITQQDAAVKIGLRLSYDTLAKLQATPRPTASPAPRAQPRPRPRPRP